MQMWRCWPLRRWLGIALIAVGVILLVIFIPVEFWTIVLGILMILAGIFCLSGGGSMKTLYIRMPGFLKRWLRNRRKDSPKD